ncbi:MAG: hypothetical protein JWO03_1351, partial [Bacteroidetes bacterium]|nr:hypothetical protein [Bacteroidota bacterium]
QELKCTIQLNHQKITGVDPSTFQALQASMTEFMNQRAWTQDVFAPEERIECSLFITLDGVVSQDQYSGNITIQAARPAFNSTYNSPMLNFRDLDFIFTYAPNTPLEFNVNQYQSNLTSVLAYYAYLIIGLDYESMSKGGGTKYFTLAEQITNSIPSTASDSKGWKPFDSNPVSGNKNRYNIISSIMGGKFEGYKGVLYDYHLLGMDNFYDDPVVARINISNALDKLDKTFKDNPNNVLLILFLQTKGDELVSIFSGADAGEKTKVVNLLKRLDPANGTKYDKILKG